MEQHLACKDIINAYEVIRKWYKPSETSVGGISVNKLEKVKSKFNVRYRKQERFKTDKPTLPFNIIYNGSSVPDYIPDETEIMIALKKMKNGKAKAVQTYVSRISKNGNGKLEMSKIQKRRYNNMGILFRIDFPLLEW